jgi:hypothetical protein
MLSELHRVMKKIQGHESMCECENEKKSAREFLSRMMVMMLIK